MALELPRAHGDATPDRAAPNHGRRVLAAAALLVASALIAVHALFDQDTLGDWAYLAVGVGSAAAAWVGARWSGFHISLALIALGVTLSATGDVIWQYFVWTAGDGPNISVADVAWLGSYAAIGAALLGAARRRSGLRVDRDGIVDVVVVFMVAMLAQWELALHAIVTDSSVSVLVRVVWALYPTFDAVLLALVMRAVISRRLQGWAAWLMAGGSVCWLMSDFAFTLFAVEGGFAVWMNVGWLVGAVLLAAATFRGRDSIARVGGATSGATYSGIMVALVPLLLPGGIAVIQHVRGAESDPILLYIATLTLLALAFTRAARLLKAEKDLREVIRSQERFAQALAANSSDAVAVLGEDGTILHDAPQLAELTGHLGAVTRGQDAFSLVAPVDVDSARAMFKRCLTRHGQTFDADLRVLNGLGKPQWLSARMVNLINDPDVGGVVVNLHDITDRKTVEEALSYQAFHDGLTDLANRALFIDRVEHALHRNSRTAFEAAVLFLDLDGFKTVNDSLGHVAGDVLLKEVAQRLNQAVRAGDTVARLGGDEFAILIEQSPHPLDESEAVAERVLQALATPIVLESQAVTVSASIGIATSGADTTATSLLRDADVAMYRAKTSGKARWCVYDPDMRTAAVERLQLETDLVGALEAGQFALVYQPVVTLETERIVGFEALLRWHHPTLGLVMPDRFIPIAESSGLIVSIGEWVLDAACATAARWHRDYPAHGNLSMAVNISARQIASPDLVAHVGNALANSGLEPRSLVVEMTETALIQDTSVAAARLHQLRDLGVRLAIDDFGTGYSSLSYLRQFPVDILKIDRSFINTITDRGDIPAIVRAMLDLGRTLELETVAEGIELGVQLDQLREQNCDLGQGYLFSLPLEPVDAELLLVQLTPASAFGQDPPLADC
ncbi:MAG TPA: EAL domain-containing protein [Ilumatobacteraceae bacterium]|nr:EAL domain-containing protein [Ilumatobacteraceae bacterium]